MANTDYAAALCVPFRPSRPSLAALPARRQQPARAQRTGGVGHNRGTLSMQILLLQSDIAQPDLHCCCGQLPLGSYRRRRPHGPGATVAASIRLLLLLTALVPCFLPKFPKPWCE